MKEKKLFLAALTTLIYSWGSDAPPEAIWAFNELIEWYEKEYGKTINIYMNEDEDYFDTFDKIIEKIKLN